MEQTIQHKVMKALSDGHWRTVGEVAQEIGVQKNATIRCVLDTLVYANLVKQDWGKFKKQQTKYYRREVKNN